jgi:hypothetical protein
VDLTGPRRRAEGVHTYSARRFSEFVGCAMSM